MNSENNQNSQMSPLNAPPENAQPSSLNAQLIVSQPSSLNAQLFSETDLPPVLRVYYEAAPESFRLPAILTALTCLCALGTRLRARYVYDIELHALLLQVIVVGNPGDGKSFTRPIVKQLMAPLLLRDQELRRQEQAYNELKKTSAKNKQLPEEPITDVRCLQNITRAKLVKRADMFIRKYGEPLAFLLFSEELSTMTEGNKKAYSDLRTIGRLAYDLGATFSTDTNSSESYCAMVDIIWCSLYCSTPAALDEYMDKRSIEGGNVTRHVIADLGDLMGDDAPVFQPLTEEQLQLVRLTVDRLMHETYTDEGGLQPIHEVPMEWLDGEVKAWCQTQRERVLKTGSRALNCFYKRASVSAFRMTALCYHLWGEQPGDSQQRCVRFYRFMADYILGGLLARWGKRFEELQGKGQAEEGPKVPLFDQLPDRFSRDQLRELIVKLELSTPARVFLSKWKRAHLIHQPDMETDLFIKNYSSISLCDNPLT